MQIIKTTDHQQMSRYAANIISAQVIMKPTCVLGLATGATPMGIYKQLIEWYRKNDVDFSLVTSVNLDEYCDLSGDHEQSYRYYMNENFFRHINIAPENTFLPAGDAADYEKECSDYDALIQRLGGLDLQLLGIGHDGHIGFNEPADEYVPGTHRVRLLDETIEANSRFFSGVDKVPKYALTMGIRDIMQAKKIVLVASGEEKAEILHKALTGPVSPRIPASVLQLHPNVILVADEMAMQHFA